MWNVRIADEIVSGNVQIPAIKPDLSKANPKLGVSVANFSSNCRYMFTKNGKLNVYEFFPYRTFD